jgi:hypothetical protein
MTLTRAQKSRLMKAKLFSVEWLGPPIIRRHWWSYLRFANAANFHIFRLSLSWRMPWLEHSARALHPELFED